MESELKGEVTVRYFFYGYGNRWGLEERGAAAVRFPRITGRSSSERFFLGVTGRGFSRKLSGISDATNSSRHCWS